jgi:hypothetical protein
MAVPSNYQFGQAAPGPNLSLLFAFAVGKRAAKVYAELVSRPGMYAFVTADKSLRSFLGVPPSAVSHGKRGLGLRVNVA